MQHASGASSSSSASVAASANAWRCSGVRASSGVVRARDGGGPRVGGQRVEPDVAADDVARTHASSTTSATSRLIEPSVRMLLSRRNRATANSSVSQMFCTQTIVATERLCRFIPGILRS